ncbi:hypothetical protein [Massilia sp. BJB1822]|uniref:hypothetical protein n=1 Tax=Massilia sp. BJB1822 TaxID=2744470 RepID=UPI0015933A70|nr:hypothetical protein [Massilia sp. BJB1822]NVE01379.1 hypothetical protein [Massilia sp. BJB1822]
MNKLVMPNPSLSFRAALETSTGHTIQFERTQWPVGHGGFHTGHLRRKDGESLHYFFDCGSKSKPDQLIKRHLENRAYEFGVLSHFHTDHISELQNAQLKRIFLPYLTEIDMLFEIIGHWEAIDQTQIASALATLKRWEQNGTLVWIQHGSGEPAPDDETNSEAEQFTLEAVPPALAGQPATLNDGQTIWIRDRVRLVELKFFNYRHETVSAAFDSELKALIAAGTLQTAAGIAYAAVADFMQAIRSHPQETIETNKAALTAAYAQACAANSPKMNFNLSSLTLFSASCNIPRWLRNAPFIKSTPFSCPAPVEFDGWLCSGDLELAYPVWRAFHEHYSTRLEQCLAFNVPHHASEHALCDEALHSLRGNKFLLLPVPDKSAQHPNADMMKRFALHQVPGVLRVNKQPESAFSLLTTWENLQASGTYVMFRPT